MKRRLRLILMLAAAFALLSAGECSIGDLGSLLDEPGQITVTNTGSEPAVLAIVADDVKSYPTLAGGASASVQTNTGGRYEVRVLMTPEGALEYRAELLALRSSVQTLIGGSTDPAEKTRAYAALAGIKAAIQRLDSGSGASCSGNIQLEADEQARVSASVAWLAQSGSGFWDLSCGSS